MTWFDPDPTQNHWMNVLQKESELLLEQAKRLLPKEDK
jgi:hypothetical protein